MNEMKIHITGRQLTNAMAEYLQQYERSVKQDDWKNLTTLGTHDDIYISTTDTWWRFESGPNICVQLSSH